MLDVLATAGVDGKRTTCNNALHVAAVLGVEAARRSIIDEILSTMAGHGILGSRHAADSVIASVRPEWSSSLL